MNQWMLAIAGQFAGPNKLKFLGTHGYPRGPGVEMGKKIKYFFSKLIYFTIRLPGQR